MKPNLGYVRFMRHWLLLAVVLGGVGIFLFLDLQREHEHLESQERERLATQSKVIEVNLTRQLGAINLTLESIISELPYWATQTDANERTNRRLKSMEAAMPSVRTFLVLDAQGVIVSSNREEVIGRDLHQREYFQAPKRGLNPRMLYLSPPYKSVLNNYVVNLSRAVLDGKGRFAGVVSAVVDPVDIQILLNSVRYADDMRAMLVHGDGDIFISQPTLVDPVGKNVVVEEGAFFSGMFASTEASRLSILRTVQPSDLLMDKPLVVALSRDVEALFAPWQHLLVNRGLGFLLLVLVSVACLSVYLLQRARQRMMEQRLKLATDASGVGIWELSLAKRRYHWDATMFELFGLDPQQASALNNEWQQLLLPGELARMKDATRATIKHGQVFDLTFQIQRKDGQVRFLRNRAALHLDVRGLPSRLIGATEDVTERKMREADLRVAAAAFECQEGILITDAHRVILRVNRAFTELFGYTAAEAIGQTPHILQSGHHEPSFYAAIWDVLSREGVWQGEIWNRRKSGVVFPEWLTISAVRNDEGVVTHYVQTHTDITLRKEAEEEFKHLAFYDPLTSLPNRRLLNDRLYQGVIQAKRNQNRLALMFIDLDKFKPVNDEFGHPAGDELLRAVAQRLLVNVRESDTVARIGGDEFVVLLPSIDAPQDAASVALKIHAALKQPFVLTGGKTVSISSSSGIAIYPEHGVDEAELTRHADVAMYEAKAAGRDRFVIFSPAG